jgi:predicted DNA-binding transcriptional regulator AlpA
MVDSRYVRASEVAEMLDVSKAKAYKLIAEMNNELKSQNIIVINGRVPRKYLMKRIGE